MMGRSLKGKRTGLSSAALGLSALLIVVSTLLSGCATVTAPQTPGNMNLDLKVKYYQQGASPVEAHFSTPSGNTVEFVSGETVACNSQFLAYTSNAVEQLFDYGSYTGDIPMQSAGGAYTFTYTPAQGKGSAITVRVPVINAPVTAISPTTGASVALPQDNNNQPVTLRYTPSQLDNTQILAILTDSRGKVTFTLPQPENGTISVNGSQLSGFQPGPGNIYFVRVTTTMLGGTPFRQVKAEFDNITVVQMTWR